MTDPFDDIFGTPRRRKSKTPTLTPAEEQGVLSSLGNNALSGLSFVGNVLDTPGSIVRGLLAGNNPLPGIFDPDQRTSGRQVLEQFGMVGPSRDGFHPLDDPEDAASDLGGFAAEVLLDPLTYLTLGGSALTKAGKAVKNAGLMGDVTKVASKTAGKEVGKRAARLTTTAADLFGGDAAKAAATLGISEAEATQKLGGMFGIGLPFKEPTAIGGTGKLAQKVAGGMDAAGEAIRFGNIPGTEYSPGRHFASVMDYKTKGTSTKIGQKRAIAATAAEETGRQNVGKQFNEYLQTLKDQQLIWADDADAIRTLIEYPSQAVGHPLEPLVKKVKDGFKDVLDRKQNLGLNASELLDPAMESYLPRYASDLPKGGGAVPFAGKDPASIARKEAYKGIQGGTEQLKAIFKDVDVNNLIESGAEYTDVAKLLKSKFGGVIRPRYTKMVNGKPQMVKGKPAIVNGKIVVSSKPKQIDQFKALAKSLINIPSEARKTGVFNNNPLIDFGIGMNNAERSIARGNEALNFIAQVAEPKSTAFNAGDSVRLSKITKALGFTDTSELASRMGVLPADLTNYVVPKKYADDLTKIMPKFTAPDAVGKLVGAHDQYMNAWKAGVLTAPARYVRDAVSGQLRNIEDGAFSVKDLYSAHQLLQGRDIADAANIPIVAKMLSDQGLPPEKASDMIRQLAATYELTGGHQATDVISAGNKVDASLDSALAALPGQNPLGGVDLLKTAVGKGKNGSINPTKIRGVLGNEATTFGPVAAGEKAGYYTDSLNRLTPFINMLKKGIDPAEAAKRIKFSQVDYSAKTFSPFEQKVLKRIMPFYSFTSRQAPYVAKTLAEKPGGVLAQTIRGANQATKDDQPLPDKVTSGLAIPLGQQADGTKRFITSLGNMAEDVLTLPQIGDSPLDTISKTGRNLMGRVNPLLKAPVEIASGKLLFSGQELRDADPSIGRTITSIKDRINGTKTADAAGTGNDNAVGAEYAATLIPGVSRTSNIVRTAVDQRKSLGDKALNLLTGIKVTDISPRTQEAVTIERVKDQLKKSGGKVLERPYIPQYRRDAAGPGELDRADDLLGLLKAQDKRRQAERKKSKPKKLKGDSIFGF